MVRWAERYEMAVVPYGDDEQQSSSQFDAPEPASIRASLLALEGIRVDSSKVNSKTIARADFSAVTAQATFLHHHDDSISRKEYRDNSVLGNDHAKTVISFKSCCSHPLQLMHESSHHSKNVKVHEAMWYGKGAGAVVHLFSEQKSESAKSYEVDGSGYGNDVPGLVPSRSSLNSSGDSYSQLAHNIDGGSHKKQFEILIKLTRGRDELLLGVCRRLAVPIHSENELMAFAKKHEGSCQPCGHMQYRLNLSLPVETSSNDYGAPALKRSKSFKRVKSFGRRSKEHDTLKFFEFQYGDGRKYGIPSSNSTNYSSGACLLKIRLDVTLSRYHEEAFLNNNEWTTFNENVHTNTASKVSSRKNEFITPSWDSKNDFETENQEVFDFTGFLPAETDNAVGDTNTGESISRSRNESLPWNELKTLQQQIHLNNLKELSTSVGDITDKEKILGDASVSTNLNDGKIWSWNNIVDSITSFTPCTSISAACTELRVEEENIRVYKKKAKEKIEKMNLPKNEEEFRATIQKMSGIHCGVPTNDGTYTSDLKKDDFYVPHRYRDFPVSTDSVIDFYEQDDEDVSTLGSLASGKAEKNIDPQCSTLTEDRLNKHSVQMSSQTNILSTDSFQSCSDVFQNLSAGASDIFDDISSIVGGDDDTESSISINADGFRYPDKDELSDINASVV